MPKERLDGLIKFRTTAQMEMDFAAAAARHRREPADLARIVIEDFLAKEEAALRETGAVYRPNSAGVVVAGKILGAAAAHARGAGSASPAPKKPISYSTRPRSKKQPKPGPAE